jgi:8-oxo-dGTP pyrophosphatase MutT (NUDIX family)
MIKNYFQVSVKGLVFDEAGRVMFLEEERGTWDLPGGRLEPGEGLIACLLRECGEELGVKCVVLDKTPYCAWTRWNKEKEWRVMICYRIKPEHFDFKTGKECVGYKFLKKTELDNYNLCPQTRGIKDWI